jgi:hypothetical protein
MLAEISLDIAPGISGELELLDQCLLGSKETHGEESEVAVESLLAAGNLDRNELRHSMRIRASRRTRASNDACLQSLGCKKPA